MANNVNKTEKTNDKINKTEENNVNKTEKTKVVALPVDPLNKKNNIVEVIINGKSTKVKRGIQQTVSKDVYERLVIAGYIIEE